MSLGTLDAAIRPSDWRWSKIRFAAIDPVGEAALTAALAPPDSVARARPMATRFETAQCLEELLSNLDGPAKRLCFSGVIRQTGV